MSDEIKKEAEGQSPADETLGRDPSRRDVVKALASVPVLGVFFAGWYQKKLDAQAKREAIMSELGITEGAPAAAWATAAASTTASGRVSSSPSAMPPVAPRA